ncbi:cfc5a8f4-dac1-4dd6-82b6-ad4bda0bf72b [Thermothielavioides terrestris]|nr:cfc5a8f4-dac1-4dd6-82b6-ad4bda0bf72b [Thermothielavioides terrestris]
MKEILRRDFPGLHLLKDTEANRAKVADALRAAWERVPQDLIDRLIDSMPRRLQAVRKAKGWYTKY